MKRKFPSSKWSDIDLSRRLGKATGNKPEDILKQHQSNGRMFFFDKKNLPKFSNEEAKKRVVSDAEEILQNRLRYFFAQSFFIGEKLNWFINPRTGQQISPDKHWTQISNFDPRVGDIKFIWEPSRFAWAYTLVRAYSVTGREVYAEQFWSLFESWLENNQPNMGPNYACGQECAIRLMATCFALYGLWAAKASSIERKSNLIRAVAFHAERIEKNIGFAVSTRTNHSLTEATGLYTAGMLFPEFKDAARWVKLGKKILTREGLKQIYPDGSYVQHSMNYHRLMLQDYLWAIRLGQLNGDDFDDEIDARVMKAVEFIYENQDDKTGRAPNYGANDGSLIIPLNSCDYNDYRPVIQSCWYLFKREKLYQTGPWDEDLMWLFGPKALSAPASTTQRKSREFKCGGYYTLRSKRSWAMCRCHSYKNRVGHVDPVHLDLWADGINLLRDSGTYSYFAPDELQLEYYFKSIRAHNTIIIDDVPPLQLISRFMWWPLPKARVLKFNSDGLDGEFQGENLAYSRRPWHISHRRGIVVRDDKWKITDEISGRGEHNIELRWQVPAEASVTLSQPRLVHIELSGEWRLEVSSPDTIKNVLLMTKPNAGYESLYYGCKRPGAALSITKKGLLPAVFHSIVRRKETAGK